MVGATSSLFRRGHSPAVELMGSETRWSGFKSRLCHLFLVRSRAGYLDALCLSLLKCKRWRMLLPELAVRSKGFVHFKGPARSTARSGPSTDVYLLSVFSLSVIVVTVLFPAGIGGPGQAPRVSPAQRGSTAGLCWRLQSHVSVCFPCFSGTRDF